MSLQYEKLMKCYEYCRSSHRIQTEGQIDFQVRSGKLCEKYESGV